MNSDDLKLSRRIQNLVPLLVMLTLALLVLVPAPAGAVDKFVIGDRVEVSIASINVRAAPGQGPIIGTQPQGRRGTVDGGPAIVDSDTYWRFDWDVNDPGHPDGWTREDNITKVVPPPPPKFAIGDRVEVSIASINVRAAPGQGPVIGTQPQGRRGTVDGGPAVVDSDTYWRFDWDVNDHGSSGWLDQRGQHN